MNVKTRRTKKQVNVENQAIKLLAKEELGRKIEVIKKELRSYTWRDLETMVSLLRTINSPSLRMTCL